MPDAVCDSSVLITFAKVGRPELLPKAFGRPLIIPQEVYAEAVVGGMEKKEPDAVLIGRLVKDGSVEVRKVKRLLDFPFIDAGEKAVISLALEQRLEWVCIDESQARNAARQAGLKPMGTLGVLTRLVKLGFLKRKDAFELVDRMVGTDFRISAKVLDKFRETLLKD